LTILDGLPISKPLAVLTRGVTIQLSRWLRATTLQSRALRHFSNMSRAWKQGTRRLGQPIWLTTTTSAAHGIFFPDGAGRSSSPEADLRSCLASQKVTPPGSKCAVPAAPVSAPVTKIPVRNKQQSLCHYSGGGLIFRSKRRSSAATAYADRLYVRLYV
jgi:hypothetical protein